MQRDGRLTCSAIRRSRRCCHGAEVLAPDWNSHAADGGRGDLLASLRLAREFADHPNGMVLVGWSLGGVAAAALTLEAARFDVQLAHTVCRRLFGFPIRSAGGS